MHAWMAARDVQPPAQPTYACLGAHCAHCRGSQSAPPSRPPRVPPPWTRTVRRPSRDTTALYVRRDRSTARARRFERSAEIHARGSGRRPVGPALEVVARRRREATARLGGRGGQRVVDRARRVVGAGAASAPALRTAATRAARRVVVEAWLLAPVVRSVAVGHDRVERLVRLDVRVAPARTRVGLRGVGAQ